MFHPDNYTAELIFAETAYTPSQLVRARAAIAAGVDPTTLDPWYMDHGAAASEVVFSHERQPAYASV